MRMLHGDELRRARVHIRKMCSRDASSGAFPFRIPPSALTSRPIASCMRPFAYHLHGPWVCRPMLEPKKGSAFLRTTTGIFAPDGDWGSQTLYAASASPLAPAGGSWHFFSQTLLVQADRDDLVPADRDDALSGRALRNLLGSQLRQFMGPIINHSLTQPLPKLTQLGPPAVSEMITDASESKDSMRLYAEFTTSESAPAPPSIMFQNPESILIES